MKTIYYQLAVRDKIEALRDTVDGVKTVAHSTNRSHFGSRSMRICFAGWLQIAVLCAIRRPTAQRNRPARPPGVVTSPVRTSMGKNSGTQHEP